MLSSVVFRPTGATPEAVLPHTRALSSPTATGASARGLVAEWLLATLGRLINVAPDWFDISLKGP
jgi:hypothetical protein